MNDYKYIILKIQKTKIFTDEIKQKIIKYFNKLNTNQKKIIFEAIQSEKIIILNFLKSLKDKEIISFEDIKTNVEHLQKEKRILDELQEKKDNNKELSKLLNNLDII